MSVYVIGDIQGCFNALECLYQKLEIDPSCDQVWLAGDLVNRGPQSLETLRFAMANQGHIKVVLGNHDLHLLAIYHGAVSKKRKDTLSEVLSAPDCEELMHWLRHQPLMLSDTTRNMVLSHAGIPHIWSITQAKELSAEVEAVLRAENPSVFFSAMYGNSPSLWSNGLQGMTRLRVITNYLTRMRFVSLNGELDFAAKDGPGRAPQGFQPWFSYPRSESLKLYFGHWAALMGNTGNAQFVGVDTGCVWGNYLTAADVDTGKLYCCDCGRKA